MHFLSLGGLLARLGLEEELWAVPKSLNSVMVQFIPRNHSCFLSGAGTLLHPQEQGVLFPGFQADPSPPSSSGYVTDQLNNANLDLSKWDKSH